MSVKKPVKVQQPPIIEPQQVTDEQAINVMNRLRTKGAGAVTTIDDMIGEFGQLFSVVVNQKNKEIAALKEALAKADISKKIEKKP